MKTNSNISFGTTTNTKFLTKSFSYAALSFFAIMIISIITLFVIDGDGSIRSVFTKSYDFDTIGNSFAGTQAAFTTIKNLLIISSVLLVVSYVTQFIWIFRINTAGPILIGIVYASTIIAQGISFGFLYIVMNTTELVSIFGIATAIFSVMAIVGWLSKDLSGMGRYLMMGMAVLFISVIVQLILSVTGVGYSILSTFISFIMGMLFLGITAYDFWLLKKTNEWMEESGAPSDVVNRYALWFGYKILADFLALIWLIVRMYLRSR